MFCCKQQMYCCNQRFQTVFFNIRQYTYAFEIYSENTAIMMSKDSTKLQSHRKEIFTRWLSSTFFVSDAQSINDSFVYDCSIIAH